MDRSVTIEICNTPYELYLSTAAVMEISRKYGGLEKFGETLEASGDAAFALSEVVSLVTLLANQAILRDNILNGTDKKLLTEEAVQVLTSPGDLAEFRNAIGEAISKGMQRNIKSEDDEKNATTG